MQRSHRYVCVSVLDIFVCIMLWLSFSYPLCEYLTAGTLSQVLVRSFMTGTWHCGTLLQIVSESRPSLSTVNSSRLSQSDRAKYCRYICDLIILYLVTSPWVQWLHLLTALRVMLCCYGMSLYFCQIYNLISKSKPFHLQYSPCSNAVYNQKHIIWQYHCLS